MDFELRYLEFSDPETRKQMSGFFIWTGRYYMRVQIDTVSKIEKFNQSFIDKEVIIDKEGRLIYDK